MKRTKRKYSMNNPLMSPNKGLKKLLERGSSFFSSVSTSSKNFSESLGKKIEQEKENSEQSNKVRMVPLLLLFTDLDLEEEFLNVFYGKKRSLRFSFACFIGALMYGQFALSADLELPAVWWITDLVVAAWFVFLGFMFLVPIFVQLRYVMETVVALTCIVVTFRTGFHDIYLEGLLPPASPIKIGLFSFEIIYNVVLRPRCVWVLFCCIVNWILFAIYTIWVHWNVLLYDYRIIITISSYFINEALIFMFIHFVNKSCRSLFLKNNELLLKRKTLKKEEEQSVYLLKNILPENFIEKIKAGKLEEKNYLSENVNAAILECDICGFTQWSSNLSPKRVTLILNFNFSFIDTICSELGLEKVKTVGDAFIAFCHDVEETPNLILLGIGIINTIHYCNSHFNTTLRMRVGVGDGFFRSVVLGSSYCQVSYDIYGNSYDRTVRLEETADENSVNCSSTVYLITKEYFKFAITGDGDRDTRYLLPIPNLSCGKDCIKDKGMKNTLEVLEGECNNKYSMQFSPIKIHQTSEPNKDILGNGNELMRERGHSMLKEQFSYKSKSSFNRLMKAKGKIFSKVYGFFRCDPRDKLIKFLCVFDNFNDEFKVYKRELRNSFKRNMTIFVFVILFYILIYIYAVTTFKTDLFTTANPFIISTYVGFSSSIISILIMLLAKIVRNKKFTLLICLFTYFVNILIFKANYVLILYTGVSDNTMMRDLIGMIGLMDFLFLLYSGKILPSGNNFTYTYIFSKHSLFDTNNNIVFQQITKTLYKVYL